MEFQIQWTDSPFRDLPGWIAHHSGDRIVRGSETNDGKWTISVYDPPACFPAPYPTVILIHGGGWASRKIFDDQTEWAGDYLGYLGRGLANRGCLAISLDYRLMQNMGQSDGYQLTDLYDDCVNALQYISAHPAEFRVDPNRTAVLGESAGGYLAGALATFSYRELPFRWKTAILVNPITTLHDPIWGKCVPRKSLHPILRHRDPSQYAALLSPVDQISASTCPVLLLHGTEDHSVDPVHSEQFYNKMQEKNREAVLCRIPKASHAFLLPEYRFQQEACECALRILFAHLERRLR